MAECIYSSIQITAQAPVGADDFDFDPENGGLVLHHQREDLDEFDSGEAQVNYNTRSQSDALVLPSASLNRDVVYILSQINVSTNS